MTTWYQRQPFSRLPLTSSSPMPSLSLVSLDHLSLVTAVGDDTMSYLQGQLTCDLISMEKGKSTLAAHCDAKGKVWSVLRLFHHADGIAYVQSASLSGAQLTELKKYAVFSKTTIEASELVLLGLMGENADSTIERMFSATAEVTPTQSGTAVKIEANRWLLAVNEAEADDILSQLSGEAELADSSLWTLADLRAALPLLHENNISEFIPQALNLQVIGDAISFKKGCYTGQETVARAKYRGINKRAAFLLTGEASTAPQPGDTIERSVGENWRSGGAVLSGYRFDDGKVLALAVLPNNLDDDSQFRPANEPDCRLEIIQLPYSLEDND
ncbi:tRNA-modifying protein YgfZ [Veronia pacifica]|uniref:tRNA-modifying protein YgfZ n=1 Tax=Veronia pacifica TaxID=1080227 RepID=A0A1C3EIZ7_9GAMM|nr:tRNA-modifying protein YgfZ [Veronia pacifica]ODA33207.1 tRNA-modifying protein [Veronia pacifica]